MNEETKNPYARLLSWEVWNFMAIKNGKCDFDERNIINLKGYNDSGKSAMLTALNRLILFKMMKIILELLLHSKVVFKFFVISILMVRVCMKCIRMESAFSLQNLILVSLQK